MNLQQINNLAPWEWPEEAGEILRKILADRSADPSERLLAAEMAGNMVVFDDDLAGTLLSVVTDNDEAPAMRARAVIALGPGLEQADTDGFDDPDDIVLSEGTFRHIRETLRKTFDDSGTPKEVRRRVLEAAVRAPEPWHRKAIETAFADGDPEWRLTAVFCTQFVNGFEPRILEALRSDDPDIRYEAFIAAGNWEVKEAWPDIEKVIAHAGEDDPLLFAAIVAAADLGLPEAIEPLQERLAQCNDDDLIDVLHESLAMLGAMGDMDDDFDEEDDW